MNRIFVRIPLLAILLLSMFAGSALANQYDEQTTILRRGMQPSTPGASEHYTSTVRIDQPFTTESPARLVGEQRSFEAKARTVWHDTPAGQSIVILSGSALVQEENGPVETAYAGDVISFPPKVKHWFGAAPNTAMSALVVAETVNGTSVNWQEKVSDAQYAAKISGKTSQHLSINRAGSQPSARANPQNFTGEARVDTLFNAKDGANAYGAMVTFEPCARTDWHSHPMGQTLIVTMGRGYMQRLGGPLHELKLGDISWTPADVVHWHGASRDTAMAHIALSEGVEGKTVTWGANVTDKEYGTMNTNEMPLAMQKISLIAAFTANGDMDRLKTVLAEGLEAGLTVNQIKEVLIHTYAYAGFPRSLNGINAFMAVMDEREKAGIKDIYGPESRTVKTDKTKYEYGHDVLAILRDPAFKTGPAGSLKLPTQRPRYETFTPPHRGVSARTPVCRYLYARWVGLQEPRNCHGGRH